MLEVNKSYVYKLDLIKRAGEIIIRANGAEVAWVISGAFSALAFIAASANENEKRHAGGLLDKTVAVTGGRVETLVIDSQYSSRRFREKVADCGVIA